MAHISHKERVISAILRQQVDRPPRGELCIDDAAIAEVCGCDLAAISFTERKQFVTAFNMDLICISPDYGVENSRLLVSASQVNWPDLARWVVETDLFPFVLLDGPFGWGIRIWGFENFILKVIKKDPEVTALISAVEELNCRLAVKAVQEGAAGVVLADDVAYQNGPFLSPEMLMTEFFPSYRRQVADFKKKGLYVFFHSDGNLAKIMDMIVDTGVHGLQCLEEAAGMDLAQLQYTFGSKLCLWGNLDPVYLAETMDEGVLEEKVRTVVTAGMCGPGFIFGSSSGLFREMRIELLQQTFDILDRMSVPSTGSAS